MGDNSVWNKEDKTPQSEHRKEEDVVTSENELRNGWRVAICLLLHPECLVSMERYILRLFSSSILSIGS